MKLILQSSVITILLFSLSACFSTKKSDADGYEDMRNSKVYKSYKKISIKALNPIVKELNEDLAKKNKNQNGATQVHALLSLVWIATAQPKLALADAEYAEEQATDPRDRYAALTLKALAMHEKGWHFQAKETSLKARALVQQNDLKNRYNNLLLLAHVGGSVLALKDGEIPYVIDEIRSIGLATDQKWLVGVSDASDNALKGASDQAISKLEDLKNRPDLSDKERNGVSKVLEHAKKGGQDVVFNMLKSAVGILLEDTIRNSSLTKNVISKLPKDYRQKLAGYSN